MTEKSVGIAAVDPALEDAPTLKRRDLAWPLLLASIWAPRPSSAGELVWLVSEDEARLPVAHGATGTRAITRGPAIRYLAPTDMAVNGRMPFRLRVEFAPHGGARIELSTVRVTLLRGPGIDITSRLSDYLTPSGLDVPEAVAPMGLFAFRIEAADAEGRHSMAVIQIDVR